MVMIRVGNQDYPARNVPQCKTCQSPNRMLVEQLLLTGRSYRNIEKELVGLPAGPMGHPSYQGVREHAQHHMPIAAATRRKLIERRAQQVGKDIETHTDTLVDYITVAEMVVQEGYDKLVAGEMKVDAAALLTAIKTVHAINADAESGIEAGMWQEALFAYMEVAQRFIPEDQRMAFGRAIKEHPVIQGIAAKRAEGKTIPGEVA